MNHHLRKIPLLPAIALLALLAAAPQTRAALYNHITFENATISEYKKERTGTDGFWTLTDTGKSYKISTRGHADANTPSFTPVVTDTAAHAGKKAILMKMEATTARTTQKCSIDVCSSGSKPASPWFGDTRAISFAMKLPAGHKPDTSEIKLCQWWRGTTDVELVIRKDSARLQVKIRNAEGTTKTHDIGALTPGQWHTLALQVTPNFTANGRVQAWQDGTPVLDISDTTVGANPGDNKRRYGITLGLQRTANNAPAEACFDEIRLGDTYEDIRPPAK